MADDVTIRIGAQAKGVANKLKSIGKSFAVVGTAAAATGGAILALTNHVTKNVDKLGKMSTQLGTSTEFLSGLEIAAELGGSNIEEMGSAIVKMTKNANDATKGIGVAKDTFKELGIKVTDASGNLREADDLLPELADKFKDMGAGAKTTAAAVEIFGRSGAKLIPTLLEGSEGFKKSADEARRFGTIIDEEAKANAAEFQDTLLRVRKVSGGFIQQIGLGFAPVLTELGKTFLDSGISAEDFADSVTQFAAAAISVAIDTMRDFLRVGSKVLTWFSFFTVGDAPREIQDFADKINDFANDSSLDILNNKLAELAASTKKTAKDAPSVSKGLANAVALGSKFSTDLENTARAAGKEFAAQASKPPKQAAVGEAIILDDNTDDLFSDAGESFTDVIMSGVTDALDFVTDSMNDIIKGIASGSEAAAKMAIEATIMATTGLPEEVAGPISDILVQAATNPEFFAEFSEGMSTIVEGIIANVIPGIISGLPQIIPDIILAVVRGLFTLFKTLFTAQFWIDAGDNFVDGFRETFGAKGFLTDMWKRGELEEVGRQMLTGLVNAVNKHNEIGLNIANGILDLAKKIGRKISEGITGGGGDGGVISGTNTILDSFATGTPFVPQTGLFKLHRGEAVIPAEKNTNKEQSDVGILNLTITDSITRQLFRSFADAINDGNPEGRAFSRIVVQGA